MMAEASVSDPFRPAVIAPGHPARNGRLLRQMIDQSALCPLCGMQAMWQKSGSRCANKARIEHLGLTVDFEQFYAPADCFLSAELC